MAKDVVDFMEGVVDKGKEQVAMEVTLTIALVILLQLMLPCQKTKWERKGENYLEKDKYLDHNEKKNGEEKEEIIWKRRINAMVLSIGDWATVDQL